VTNNTTEEIFPVCLIMVTYNGANCLASTIASLKASTQYPHQLLLVDNASTDTTIAVVEGVFPEAIVVRLRINRGYSFGVNAGISKSKEMGFRYHCVLNQDLVFTPGWLEALLNAHRKRGGTVGPPMRGLDVNGSVLLFTTDTIDLVGMFCDKLYFMYGEDNEFLRRCAFMGVPVTAVPESAVGHDHRDYAKHRRILPWLFWAQFMLALTNPRRPFGLNVVAAAARWVQVVLKALFRREWTDASVIPEATRQFYSCMRRYRHALQHWKDQRVRASGSRGPAQSGGGKLCREASPPTEARGET
jgi:GT2 family glycosyltransferase